MIKYICHNCNDIECETSTCPVCGQRASVASTSIYWCKECNCPSFSCVCEKCGNECEYISTDLRPVFPQERLLLEVLLGHPFCYAGKSVWNANGNTYIIDSQKKTISFSSIIRESNVQNIISSLKQFKEKNKIYCDEFYKNDYIKNFIEVNKYRLKDISNEAYAYIKKISSDYTSDSMFVSFSGGKDSTVTSHLVLTALSGQNIVHIYGDTTLEYPSTHDYIQRFKKENPTIPMLVAKNIDQSFLNLCEVIGPPSRVLRWCCTVFKTGAITKKIENTFSNKSRILTFYGIRRNESASRSKYERESQSPKITKQFVASPIIDWLDFDVWLYIISNRIDFNDAYLQGFSRVGCWCCPNNSDWSGFLSSIYMNEQYNAFRQMLITHALKTGKTDPDEYVDTGKWKARQGGNGLDYSRNVIVNYKPCAVDSKSFNFELTKEINDTLYTLFIPLGIINKEIGNKRLNEVYVLDHKTQVPIFSLIGKPGQNQLKVTIHNGAEKLGNMKEIESLIRNQITKFQTCISCHACESICRFDAIKVINSSKGNASSDNTLYLIDSNKCKHCLECVKHFSGGCYMQKVLRTKRGE